MLKFPDNQLKRAYYVRLLRFELYIWCTEFYQIESV